MAATTYKGFNMPTYRVKEGHTAFVNSALREGGYVFSKEKPYQRTPEYVELVDSRKAEQALAKEAAKPKTSAPKSRSFVDTDLSKTPTVQL